MAYFTGSANSLSELLSSLVAHCTSAGWTWNASVSVLYKDAAYVRLTTDAEGLYLLGRTSLSAGDAPGTVKIGYKVGRSPVTWPVIYHAHIIGHEVYLLINYDVEFWQWLAFGLAGVEGNIGTGCFVAATLGEGKEPYVSGPVVIDSLGGSFLVGTGVVAPLPFYGTASYGSSPANRMSRNSLLHNSSGINGWALALTNNSGAVVGAGYLEPLIGIQPNMWNSEAVLLPIRAYRTRPEDMISLEGELKHSRYIRIDNLEAGQIITLGTERWKIYPAYRKNIASRDGGSGINHSGTFGWAIRYDGP